MEDDDGNSYYTDFNSIKKNDGYVYGWDLVNYVEPDNGFMSVTSFWQSDCKIGRVRELSSTSYTESMGHGEYESDTPPNPEWDYFPPETIGSNFLEMSCFLVEEWEQASPEERERLIEEIQKYYQEIQKYIRQSEQDDSSYSLSSKTIPPNAYASGDSWKCNSGYERYNNGCRPEVEDQLNTLKSAYVNHIAARVSSYWRYVGAEDDWGCDVYILQSTEGVVEAVNVHNCTLDDSDKARSFKNSIERAVYKASPLPIAPDEAVFDKEVLFFFRVN